MRLTRSKSELEPRYDAIVIGSGYGGGIAALRFAEAGLSVCVLERGRELNPVDFPANASEVVPQVQARVDAFGRARRIGSPLGLFDFRVHRGVSALVGCGVGGTSLINANVFVLPDETLFAEPEWPRALREDAAGRAAAAARAREMLRPTPEGPELDKMALMRELGVALGSTATRLPLLVNRDRATDVGATEVDQVPCNGCGNCASGCRRGAKRTVDVTYLARATMLGANVFAEMEVVRIAKAATGWAVHYQPVCRPIDDVGGPPFVLASTVVVAAGSLGSTEILLRSRDHGLPISDAVGTAFSANGNCLGAIERPRTRVRSVGRLETDDQTVEPGACITMAVEVPKSDEGPRLHIEDGTAPRLIDGFVRAVGVASRARRTFDREQPVRALREIATDAFATLVERAVNADDNAQVLLVQTDDRARGTLVLGEAGVAIDWPDYASETAHVDRRLQRAVEATGGTYRPLRPELFGLSGHVTVHPLGGCPMGEDAVTGVVDHGCNVFDASSVAASAIHEGLLVCDGAVVPRAVGKNPAATICVLVERAIALHLAAHPHVRRDRDRDGAAAATIDARTRHAPKEAKKSFVLAEAFDGWLTTDVAHDPARPRNATTPMSHPAHAHFTIETDDFARFRRDPSHPASVLGVLSSPLFGEGACSVVRGNVFLLADDPYQKDVFYNLYELGLLHPSGEEYALSGMKVWQNGGPLALWGAGTEMPVEIFRGARVGGAPWAKGFLRMSPPQFLGSLRSYWAKSERTVLRDIATRASFVSFSMSRLRARLGQKS